MYYTMSFKHVIIIYVLQFIMVTSGIEDFFFRKDYTYLEETQSFYKFYTIGKTYRDALTTCVREGATLFYANDKQELDAVLKIWPKHSGHIFIGVTSIMSKGMFTTVDGRPLTAVYNNWNPAEPNDTGNDEDCIHMNKAGTMNDITCKAKTHFICKKTLASLQWHDNCQTPYKNYVSNANLGRCYKFFLSPMNWTEAFTVCSAEESYLAVINSVDEAEFLKQLTRNAPKATVKGNYFAGVVWLGFQSHDPLGWISVKGNTLEHTGYSQWGYNQVGITEKYLCGSMFYNGELTYGECTQHSFFICEKEINSAQISEAQITDITNTTPK